METSRVFASAAWLSAGLGLWPPGKGNSSGSRMVGNCATLEPVLPASAAMLSNTSGLWQYMRSQTACGNWHCLFHLGIGRLVHKLWIWFLAADTSWQARSRAHKAPSHVGAARAAVRGSQAFDQWLGKEWLRAAWFGFTLPQGSSRASQASAASSPASTPRQEHRTFGSLPAIPDSEGAGLSTRDMISETCRRPHVIAEAKSLATEQAPSSHPSDQVAASRLVRRRHAVLIFGCRAGHGLKPAVRRSTEKPAPRVWQVRKPARGRNQRTQMRTDSCKLLPPYPVALAAVRTPHTQQ